MPVPDSRIQVRVVDVRQELLRGARVSLTPIGGQEVEPIRLKFDPRTSTFLGFGVAPGPYRLSVAARGFEGQARQVEVKLGSHEETFVLGEKGLPYYYRGRTKVPFEPTGLVGIAMAPAATDSQLRSLDDRARSLRLSKADPPKVVAEEEGVRLYRLPPRLGNDAIDRILAELDAVASVRAAGLVLSVEEEHVSFLTRQVTVRFLAQVKDQEIPQIASRYRFTVVREIPYVPNGWLLQASGQAGMALLQQCEQLVQSGLVAYAEPNTVEVVADLAINPTDWLFAEQWHIPIVSLPNAWDTLQGSNPPGVSPGDPDDRTFGSPAVIVAIMDRGIQSSTTGGVTSASHPDFAGSVTTGASKVSQFYDFSNMVPNNDAPPNDHGMGCAGVAGARANNPSAIAGVNEGVVGAAPNCRLLGAIRPAAGTNQQYADAFIWMAGFNPGWTVDGVNYLAGTVFPAPPTNPADIISNSYTWSSSLSGVMADMIDYVTTFGRGGRGVAIFWAAGNGNSVCNFGTATDPKVMAVAASSLANDGVTEIRAAYSNFGNVIEFCAPSHDAYVGGVIVHNPPTNYGVISADLLNGGNMPGNPAQQTALTAAAGPSGAAINLSVGSSAGFAVGQAVLIGIPGAAGTEAQMVVSIPNATTIRVAALNAAHPIGTQVAGGPANYTNVFGGTSSATPLAAGIAALCLSGNPDLSWIELRQILRTTATKIDFANTDPLGQWVDVTGDGVPDFSQWYGWGRLNADAAIQAALAYDQDVDIVVRDNLGDSGVVPSAGWHAESPDIWADPSDVPIPALAYTSAPPHVTPIRGQQNYVFVRVKNVGTAASSDFWIRALISHYPGFEFRYPQEWTPSNLPGQPVPSPLVPGSYLIGEVAVAGLAAGANTIVKIPWPAALVPNDTVTVGGMTVKWHPCLLAEVAPHDGPPPTGVTFDVKRFNNLAHRNITIADPDSADADLVTAVAAGTSDVVGIDSVIVDRTLVPTDYRVFVRVADERVMDRWSDLCRTRSIRSADPLLGSQSQVAGVDANQEEVEGLETGADCGVVLIDPARLSIACGGGNAVVVHAPPQTEIQFRCSGVRPRRPTCSVGKMQNQEVLFLDAASDSAIELPLRLAGGQFVPVVVGLVRSGGLRGAARLFATQRRGDGELSAGYSVEG